MAGKDPNKRPIIIKRIKKVGGGHHGGAWKVAYADFVTAMMAFFLLLWLLAQTPKETLKSLAEYFQPTVGLKGQVGKNEDGSAGSDSIGVKEDAANKPAIIYGAAPEEGPLQQAPQANDVEINDDADADQVRLSRETAEAVEAELEKKQFEEVAEEIKKAVEDNPDLREFKQNLKIDQTQEGLRIQITDLEGMSMFEVGSNRLTEDTKPLLGKLSEIIQKVNNKVAVIGHTDSKQYKAMNGYTNWDLSAERANASRKLLTETGLDDKRLFRVEGRADKEHFDPADPESPKNRRISIILLKKSIAPTD